ncbi:MAG: hypothetical protein IKK13_06620 [Clostridia bacterium]|nr:hypothetical protein [Clostridia bacterium]
MENQTNAVVSEETIPAEEIAAENEAVNSELSNTDSQSTAENEAQQAEGKGENGAEVNTEAAEEPIITVRYNHQDRGLTMAEAVTLAQKGLKMDSMADMLNDISYLAAIQDKTPAELIKSYIEAGENIKRQELIDRYGEDNEVIEVLMEKFKNENQQKFSAVKETIKQKEEAAEQDLNQRIADEFQNMKADFTELTDYASLPLDVKRAAVNGTPLKYAYLEYKYAQEKQVAAARQSAEQAAKKSAGSMVSAEGENSTTDALLRGLWN